MNNMPSKSTDSNMTLLSALLLSSERRATEDVPDSNVVPPADRQRRESLETILDEALALSADIEQEDPSIQERLSSRSSRNDHNSTVADSTEADSESSGIEEKKGSANKDATKE
jgi:hypothetical protein